MPINWKGNPFFRLLIFLVGFIIISQVWAQEQLDKASVETQKDSDDPGPMVNKISNGTIIAIKASGPAQFSSYWLDNPYRLVLEFQSKNILSKLDEEVMVNRGVIKRITSRYFASGSKRSLKSLTFELAEKVSYNIWQEDNTILLNIQSPLETSVLSIEEKGILTERELSDAVIQRLEAMDIALTQVAGIQQPSKEIQESREVSEGEITKVPVVPAPVEGINATRVEPTLSQIKDHQVKASSGIRKTIMSKVFGLLGLLLFSGLGFWSVRQWRVKNSKKLASLYLELQEKDKFLGQQKTVFKVLEETVLLKEKEYEQLKNSYSSLQLELQQKNERLTKNENELKQANQTLLQKDRDLQQAKNSIEAFKLELQQKNEQLTPNENILKEDQGKALSVDGKEEPGEAAKSPERRAHPRLLLTKDFYRSVVARIESSGAQNFRLFAKNSSCEGLCLEINKDFKENDSLTLRLFFYGNRVHVPMIKVKALIVWKKAEGLLNRYGLCFDLLDEKNKEELSRFIESQKEVLENELSLVS